MQPELLLLELLLLELLLLELLLLLEFLLPELLLLELLLLELLLPELLLLELLSRPAQFRLLCSCMLRSGTSCFLNAPGSNTGLKGQLGVEDVGWTADG